MRVLAALDQLADVGDAGGAQQLAQLGELSDSPSGSAAIMKRTLTGAPAALSVDGFTVRPARGRRGFVAAADGNAYRRAAAEDAKRTANPACQRWDDPVLDDAGVMLVGLLVTVAVAIAASVSEPVLKSPGRQEVKRRQHPLVVNDTPCRAARDDGTVRRDRPDAQASTTHQQARIEAQRRQGVLRDAEAVGKPGVLTYRAELHLPGSGTTTPGKYYWQANQ